MKKLTSESVPSTLTELFNETLFRIAIQVGIPIREYWDMTLGEIQEVIIAYSERERTKAKESLATNYNLATLVATFVLGGMNGKEPPSLSTLYPDLFEEEVVVTEDDKIAFLRAQLNEFAEGANKQRRNK